jgi:hypothetical protein
MLFDRSGQGIVEYVVLIALVVMVVPVVIRIFRAIRGQGETAASGIENLSLDAGP